MWNQSHGSFMAMHNDWDMVVEAESPTTIPKIIIIIIIIHNNSTNRAYMKAISSELAAKLLLTNLEHKKKLDCYKVLNSYCK